MWQRSNPNLRPCLLLFLADAFVFPAQLRFLSLTSRHAFAVLRFQFLPDPFKKFVIHWVSPHGAIGHLVVT